MKLLVRAGGRCIFRLEPREKLLLDDALCLYPMVPTGYHTARQGEADGVHAETEALLGEALADRQKELRAELDSFWKPNVGVLSDGDGEGAGFRLILDKPHAEWFLQVLNDVRVGCWLKLGSPDSREARRMTLTPVTSRYYVAMEACAYFQMNVLEALRSPG